MPDQKPQRIPLFVEQGNRDTSRDKDARLVNAFVEAKGKDSIHVYKRPGIIAVSGGAGIASAGNGVFFWSGAIYSVFGPTLYKDGVSIGTVVDQRYTFSSTLGATRRLFIKGAATAYVYDTTGGLVEVTDVDYPAETVPGSAYLNSVTYVMDKDANIHGSESNDNAVWDPLNKLVAQIEPDGGVALAKQLVYVVALKEWSTEAFFDAGNAAGSPLSPVQGAKSNYGCRWAESLQEIDGALVWVGQTRSGPVEVLVMDGLKVQPISDPRVSRLLEDWVGPTIYSWRAKIAGHKFYGVTSVEDNHTLVFDFHSKLWHDWARTSGNYLQIASSDFSANGRTLLQHTSNGFLGEFSMATPLDFGFGYDFDIYTPNFDAGTSITKYLKRMDLVADKSVGLLYVRYSEDDYQTWSAFRTWDLSQKRPFITDCGSFTRRAWNIRHFDSIPLRLEAVEYQLDLGTL